VWPAHHFRSSAVAYVLSTAIALCGASPSARAEPKSVYKLNPGIDVAVIASTAAANIVPEIFASDLIKPRCPCNPGEVNSFDRGVIGNNNRFLDSLSDVSVGIAVVAPAFFDALDVGLSHVLAEDLTVYVETLTVSGAFTTLAKYTVQRPLPRVYAGQDPTLASEPGGYRSFYSGHASTTFSALTAASLTYNLRHPSSVWPWVITGVYGTSVAAERVAAGRHFYTDVIVGALAGSAVGFVIPWLHERDETASNGEKREITLAPVSSGVVLNVRWIY
jgi:membrane-associated phospholipid phosphatase